MYTIFKNESSIILTDDTNFLTKENCYLWTEFNEKKKFDLLHLEAVSKVYLYHADLVEMWQDFRNMFTIIEASGGIVSNDKEELLFIFRHGKWDLPKGKIEAGETKEIAGLREVEEECGLKELTLKKYIGATYHIYEEHHKEILKISYWFEMVSNEIELVPQLEEGITDLAWIPENKLSKVLNNTYANIELLIDQYMSKENNKL